ncbi:MAG: SocA family protein [Saprospiraceae bacterium]|nr:SocA family protein [Saprospiraceae bacterium]
MKSEDLGEYVTFCINKSGDTVSPKKLQKLLYYIQAWHLVHLGVPILLEDFEAWVHGPVLPSLFRSLKENGFNKLNVVDDEGNNLEDAKDLIDKCGLTDEQVDLIDSVLLKYGALTAFELEMLSHNEEPWIEARKGLPPHAPCNNVIKKDRIKRFYLKMLEENGE